MEEGLWPRGCVCSAAVCLAAAAKDFGPAQIWKQLLVLSCQTDNHLTRGSLWTSSFQKRIGERNWKPPKNLWSRLTLWKQSSIAASCLMNRNYWHPFFFFLPIWNQDLPLFPERERDIVDIDRLASFRSLSPLHLLPPASSCLSNRNWFQLSVLKVVSIPKMHLEDRGETGRSGGATSFLLFTVFFRLKTALLKKRLCDFQLARQTIGLEKII